jgi:hypothetical protein
MSEVHDQTPAAPAPAATASPPAPVTSMPRHGKSFLRLVLEVALIAVGVFIGLIGEQWRQNRENQEMAATALRRLRVEVETNRKAVAAVQDYHLTAHTRLRERRDPKATGGPPALNAGLRPVFFEQTAWDLAIATQSLTHIDSELAFRLSRIYGLQQLTGELTKGVTQAMYLRPPFEFPEGFANAVELYLGELAALEPRLIEMYDEVLPRVDAALGDDR